MVVAVLPDEAFCGAISVTVRSVSARPATLACQRAGDWPWRRLRTLHSSCRFHHPSGSAEVIDEMGDAAWLWLPVERGGLLLVGSDLARDLVRYRQGDPAAIARRTDASIGGIPGERPIYLFEEQLAGEAPFERHADWWAAALAQSVSARLKQALLPILPKGAPGAVLVTGDDDQAYLETYEAQLELLGATPITYFLHPLTQHDPESLRRLHRRRKVDFGLHPDALDAPKDYAARFATQAAWYRTLVGAPPLSVRNHGFLNDGYWGHFPSWIGSGVRFSSNLPGIDGRILNGSLLPARILWEDTLTSHWSLLTAFGDGMIFALGRSDQEAGDAIRGLADRIRSSGVPGIIVLNLHPQNIAHTREMHQAAMEVIAGGFHAWTVRECLRWFDLRDDLALRPDQSQRIGSSWLDAWRRRALGIVRVAAS
jgi:hypothetical protein